MGLEIERKFLLKNEDWRSEIQESTTIKQGYLNTHIERTVRVRVKGNKGFLTIKGKTENVSRKEFEYEIPVEEAIAMIALCEQPVIEKTRNIIKQNGFTWEIDEFDGENKGLIVAEVELENEGQIIQLPNWIDEEVSNDPKYYNSSLLARPFKNW